MSLKPVKQITAIHANDPEWLIALWLAIHGGDPGPESHIPSKQVSQAAESIIRAVAAHLDPAKQKAVASALAH
jgi:hypothetical protein